MKKIIVIAGLCASLVLSNVTATPLDEKELQRLSAEIKSAIQKADANGVSANEVVAIVVKSLQGKMHDSKLSFLTSQEKSAYVKYVLLAIIGIGAGVGIAHAIPYVCDYFFSDKKITSAVVPVGSGTSVPASVELLDVVPVPAIVRDPQGDAIIQDAGEMFKTANGVRIEAERLAQQAAQAGPTGRVVLDHERLDMLKKAGF